MANPVALAPAPPTHAAAPPTRARLVLVGWLAALSGVLYLDRICMSQAAPAIQADLGLTFTQVAYVHMAFTVAYGLFEVPSGRLGDRIGARAVLTRIVVWWSAFTALTGAATGLGMLVVVRFLFGAGEAGAYPNVARVLSRWFPAAERGRVTGLMLTAAQLGGAVAPALSAGLIAVVGWRWAFAAFGLVGVAWAVGFRRWFRDDPADHPGVNAAELRRIRGGLPAPAHPHGKIPWRAVARSAGFWVLAGIIVCSSFNSYLYYSWFSTYLQAGRGVSKGEAGLLTSLVLLGSAVGVLAGGAVADRFVGRGAGRVRARRVFGAAAFTTAAALIAAAAQAETPLLMCALAALSCLAVQLTLPTWWAAAIEQSGRHVGVVFGLLNTTGIAGAVASQWFVGAFSDAQQARGLTGRDQWDPMFGVYVGMLLAGAVGWSLYRFRPLEPADPA